MKKALITGISGFSGGYLAKHLLAQNISVYGIDIKPNLSAPHQGLKPKIRLNRVNLLNEKSVITVVKKVKPDYIFHLAALLRGDKLEDFIKINVLGTRNILESAMSVKARVLISGSSAEYGWVSKGDLPITEETTPQPIDYYGITKLLQTMLGYQYFISQKVNTYLTRVFNMTGPGEPTRMVCGSLAQQIKDIKDGKARPIIYTGNLFPKRDFIDVRDVVRAYWSVVNKGKAGEIYNICSGKAYSIKEILSKLIKISRIGKVLIKPSYRKTRFVDIPIQVGDNTKIRKATGWQPQFGLTQTLTDMLRFYPE